MVVEPEIAVTDTAGIEIAAGDYVAFLNHASKSDEINACMLFGRVIGFSGTDDEPLLIVHGADHDPKATLHQRPTVMTPDEVSRGVLRVSSEYLPSRVFRLLSQLATR